MVFEKRILLIVVAVGIFVFLNSFVLAEVVSDELHLNIQTTYSNDSIRTGTFEYQFNISDISDCSNVVYSNLTSLTTDSRGIVSYYLENVTLDFDAQYWMCYYVNGTLQNASKMARSPYAYNSRNITLSGVSVDQNLNLTSYNATTTGWFKGLFNWVINSASQVYFSFNGTTLEFNETQLNSTIDNRGVAVGFNSTYNATYDAKVTNNGTWNESYADTLYSTTYNATYAVLVSANLSWNETYADLLYLTTYNATYAALVTNNNSWNESYATTLYESTYNATYNALQTNNNSWNESYANLIYLTTYNATYDALITNNNSWNETRADLLYAPISLVGDNETWNETRGNELYVTTYNSTYDAKVTDNQTWAQTLADTLYAAITWGYNQTAPANTYTDTEINNVNNTGNIQNLLNSTGVYSTYNASYYSVNDVAQFSEFNVTSILRVGSNTIVADGSGLNITGDVNFDGTWQDGGVTINSGNLFAQTLFVYNITSLSVDSLQINGTISPGNGTWNNTFDIGIAGTEEWRYGYFGTDVLISGINVKQFLYNQTVPAIEVSQNYTDSEIDASNLSWTTTYNASYDAKASSPWVSTATSITNATTGINMGLGTATPGATLEILDDAGGSLLLLSDPNQVNWTFGLGNLNGAGTGRALSIYNTGTTDGAIGFRASASGDNQLHIGATGKVGIGTTTPHELLEVAGAAAALIVNSTSGEGAEIILADSFTNEGDWILKNRNGDGRFSISRNIESNELFTIEADGKVGIGTSSPDSLLEVNGNVSLNNSLFVTNEGNVGIGTITPISLLTVAESSTVSYDTMGETSGSIHIKPDTDVNGDSSSITFGANNAGSGSELDNAHAGVYVQSSSSYGTKMYFATTDSYAAGSKSRMMIDHQGNIGIGTSSPSSKLHINSSSSGIIFKLERSDGVGQDNVWRQSLTSSSGSGIGVGSLIFQPDSDASIGLRSSGGGYVFRVDSNNGDGWFAGDVGIGAVTPSYKLDVNGTIRTTSNISVADSITYSDNESRIQFTPTATIINLQD